MTHMYKRVAELVLKYHTGEISEEEKIELNNIRLNSGLDPNLFEELLNVHQLAADLKQMKEFTGGPLPVKTGVVYSLSPKQQRTLKYTKVAAVVIPVLTVLSMLLFRERNTANTSPSSYCINVHKNTEPDQPASDTNDHFITFEESDLQHILRQLSKDPELEVIYNKEITPVTYSGEIPHSTPYDKFAQDLLQFKGYKSTFKGNKIFVHS